MKSTSLFSLYEPYRSRLTKQIRPELMSGLGCEANFEFGTLWKTICARYAISARTLPSSRKRIPPPTDRQDRKRAVRCSTFVNSPFPFMDPERTSDACFQ
jgi:hypothetical protein